MYNLIVDTRHLLALSAIALILLSGCAQQPQAPPSPASPGQNISNASQPAVPAQITGNITQNPAPPPGALANQSANATSPSNTTNTTANATNTTLPENGTANNTAPSPGNGTNASSANQTVPSGLRFPDSSYTLVLDDVSLIPNSQGPCGIFSIRDQNGSIMDKMLICPPESVYWTAPDGHLYRIRVEKVAAGYSTQENWAQVSIFG